MSMPSVTPPRLRRDITDDLAARIVEHIRDHGLESGAHLPAQLLADQFNVSRSPVVQALKLLVQKKILNHIPNHGFYVAAAGVPKSAELGLAKRSRLTTAYFRMVEDRLHGSLGDQISERALRQRYDLTLGEVGELLNRAAQEGWAERRPGYGWTFAPVLTTPAALEQSYRLRIALEPACLMEPTFFLPQAVAERARKQEERMLSGEIEKLSPDELYERGVRYHEMLAEASGNPFFLDVLRRINRMRRLFTYSAMGDRRRYYRQITDHIQILDLLMNRRNAEAAEVMRRHLEDVLESVRNIKAGELEKPIHPSIDPMKET